MLCVIISLVDDAAWQRQLSDVPDWKPPITPTLVLAPHPDDETLGAGALIASLRSWGVPVAVVAATDGENCYDVSQSERAAIRAVREQEQAQALAALGVASNEIHRLRLADSGLALLENELTAALMQIAEPGMHLVAPWIGDFHPDHEACARAARAVAEAKGLTLTYYFFWTWHRGKADVLQSQPIRRFVPQPAALRQKATALQCHRSQLEHSSCDPILPANLLGPAAWPFEVFLPA